MKVRGTNTKVDPVYWAHLRKWPFNVPVEYDVSETEYADIAADERIQVEPVAVLVEAASVDDETPLEKRGPGRPRKQRE